MAIVSSAGNPSVIPLLAQMRREIVMDRDTFNTLQRVCKGIDLQSLPPALSQWLAHELKQDAPNYNGWANYETWCVHLWLSNDQGLWDYWRNQASLCNAEQHAPNSSRIWTKFEATLFRLSDQLKDELADNAAWHDRLGACLESDMLGTAFSEVNWSEIARALLETQGIAEAKKSAKKGGR